MAGAGGRELVVSGGATPDPAGAPRRTRYRATDIELFGATDVAALVGDEKTIFLLSRSPGRRQAAFGVSDESLRRLAALAAEMEIVIYADGDGQGVVTRGATALI